jgi:chromosome segregation ATPase
MNVKQLFKKRTEFSSEVERLREELSTKRLAMGNAILNGADPSKVAAEIRDIESRIEALQAATIAAESAAGDAAMAEQTDAERKRLEALRGQESQAYEAAVDALTEFSKRLEALQKVRAEMGFHSRHGFPYELIHSVYFTLERIRSIQPELLGLPPLPTAEEVKRTELKREIEGYQSRIAKFKKTKSGGGDLHRDAQKRIEELEGALQRAEQRLNQLG